MLYKLREECSLRQFNCKHLFRVPYKQDIGMSLLYRDFESNCAEHILDRNPLKFEDILVSINNYEVLCTKKQ